MTECDKQHYNLLACGEKIEDAAMAQMCRDRVEAIIKNLCALSGNDEIAAGELLFAVRFKHGMSQSEIANAEDVSRQAISKRIRRSKYLQELQKVNRMQKIRRRELKMAKIYRMYMVDCLPVREIDRLTGCRHASTDIARKYAESHDLPFAPRRKTINNNREKK